MSLEPDLLGPKNCIPITPTEPESLLSGSAMERLYRRVCPFSDQPLPQNPGLVLIARHRRKSFDSVFLVVGTISHVEYELAACYVPVSETTWERAQGVEQLGSVSLYSFLAGISVLVLGVILGLCGVFEQLKSVGETIGISLGVAVLLGILGGGLLLGVKSWRERSFSSKLLGDRPAGWKAGMPEKVQPSFPFSVRLRDLKTTLAQA